MAGVVPARGGNGDGAARPLAAYRPASAAVRGGASSPRLARRIAAAVSRVLPGCDGVRFMKSVQQTFAPQNHCFGCGPANEKGLRIRSFEEGDALVCEWHAQAHHQAFDGILNGGICGALLDCHSNWAATIHLMHSAGASTPPCTVTADFHVVLKRPTPIDAPL